jgi:hypothetical protein
MFLAGYYKISNEVFILLCCENDRLQDLIIKGTNVK